MGEKSSNVKRQPKSETVDVRAFVARLRSTHAEPRKLLVQIADLAYSERSAGREQDTAYLPELHESCGLEVDRMYQLLEELEHAGLIRVRSEYPFESVTIVSGANGDNPLHEIFDSCEGDPTRLYEVLVELKFERLGWVIPAEVHGTSNQGQASEADFLRRLGENLRVARTRRGMTRKALAGESGVSERFLAQIENGTGNASVLVLRQIATALNVSPGQLIAAAELRAPDLASTVELLAGLDKDDLGRAHELLLNAFHGAEPANRMRRIALVGLRGAGKSTTGQILAKRLDLPFVELGQMIERASGVSLGAIFDLYGQSGFRRFERQCLEELLKEKKEFVVATEGGVVSEPDTYSRLLSSCLCIWLRATPEDHMSRVISQGDLRPMSQSPEAMSDLQRILEAREHLYAKADVVVETSGRTVNEVVGEAMSILLGATAIVT